MDEIISYKMCAVKVRNAKLRNYLNSGLAALVDLDLIINSGICACDCWSMENGRV
jgi:hypothetical protein